MKFRVFQFWSGQPATIREGELPETVVDEALAHHHPEVIRNAFLGAIFHFGQNEAQLRDTPSVSVGDIIELKRGDIIEFWVFANTGFVDFGREKHWLFSSNTTLEEVLKETEEEAL